MLLRRWDELLDLSISVREQILRGVINEDIAFRYVAMLTRLWAELEPKVRGRDDLKKIVEEFEKFEDYYMDVMNYMMADVLNPGNVGWDSDGNLKAFDPRAN